MRSSHPLARGPGRALLCVLALGLLAAGSASAQERGFRLHRYEGTTAGSWQFLVERPWYSGLRYGAVGLTLDYSHQPLTPRLLTGRGPLLPIVDHALVGHVDLAGSLFDRVLVSASLPVTFLELGTTELVSQVGPLRTVGVGDPRVGAMVRLFGQADSDFISLHLGADLWIPVGAASTHQGDTGVRVLPRAVLAGAFADVGRWALDLGFLYRPDASYGPPALGMTAASEVRAGLAVGLALFHDRLRLGPEAQFSMQVAGANAFAVNGMNLELLGGANLLVGDQVLIGLAGGTAFLGAAGTPDARALVRLAWAPRRSVDEKKEAAPAALDDADGDGVPDALDRCPFEPETKNGIRDADGCPEYEMPPGAPIVRVLVPRQPIRVPAPPPAVDAGVVAAPALAPVDTDGDGIPDDADRCPLTPEDKDGFEDDDGCPEPDNDRDGVLDVNDKCPLEAETINGFEDDDGCPDVAPDADGDGVPDALDRCPFEPETVNGVRDEDGCPEFPWPEQAALTRLLAPPASGDAAAAEPDSDHDGIPDSADRCPVTPEDKDGFEDEDGCPEPDNDGDGIPDTQDKCPDVAETVNGFEDQDGCPDENPDVDGDGVPYSLDRCPLEAGVLPDGCPHAALPALALPGFPGAPAGDAALAEAAKTADFDHDGIPDAEDACPVTPEDKDGFEDEDGCPEPDNDHDGIPDAKDKCPFEAEVINGNKDDDGCPDLGVGVVTVTAQAVVIDGVVRFKAGSANLEKASEPLLKQVASTLRAKASLSVEVGGHTDDVGNAANNIRLSKRRAETIRTFLIRAGVAPQRLLAVGFGPTKPVASNRTAEGREKNRRVEFLILGEPK